MNSMGGLRATNVVKFAHDWQHGGQQIGLFYGGSEETVCPTGCEATEVHHHFLSCTPPPTIHSFRQWLDDFKGVHKSQRTASAIFSAFQSIILHLRHQSRRPQPFVPQFGTLFDTVLSEA